MPPIAALVCALVFLAEGFEPRSMNFIVPYSYGATFMSFFCLGLCCFCCVTGAQRGAGSLCCRPLRRRWHRYPSSRPSYPCAAGIATTLILYTWRSANPVRTLRLAIVALLPGLVVSATVFIWLVAEFKLDFLVHGNWAERAG